MKILCIALTICLTGCSSWMSKGLSRGYGPDDLDTSALKVNRLVSITQSSDGLNVPAVCFGVPTGNDIESCRQQRNSAIATIGMASDTLCQEHERTIYGNEAAFNIASGSFTNLFAGAASVIHPQATKSIFAALALFSNSERSLVNETVYKQMLVPAIVTKIGEARTAKASEIRSRFDKPLADYTFVEALWDLSSYHDACSFMSGLQAALKDGTTDTNTRKIQQLKLDLSTATLEANVFPLADRTGTRKVEYDAIQKRISDLNAKLGTLQTQ